MQRFDVAWHESLDRRASSFHMPYELRSLADAGELAESVESAREVFRGQQGTDLVIAHLHLLMLMQSRLLLLRGLKTTLLLLGIHLLLLRCRNIVPAKR